MKLSELALSQGLAGRFMLGTIESLPQDRHVFHRCVPDASIGTVHQSRFWEPLHEATSMAPQRPTLGVGSPKRQKAFEVQPIINTSRADQKPKASR